MKTTERKKRTAIARKIKDKLLDLHGDNIVAIGVFGSVARGDCGPYSDVEIFVITKKPMKIRENELVVDNVLYTIECDTLKATYNELKQPIELTQYLESKYCKAMMLYDPDNVIENIREVIVKMPDDWYQKAAKEKLHYIYEYYGKLRNAYERKDLIGAIYAIQVMFEGVAKLIALINKKRFTSENTFYIQHIEFEKVPKDYQKYVDSIRMNRLNNLKEVYVEGKNLWKTVQDFAKKHGVTLNVYEDVNKYFPKELE